MKGREYRGQPGEYYSLGGPLCQASAFAAGEHGIIGAGHELRAIKRHLVTRTDGLP